MKKILLHALGVMLINFALMGLVLVSEQALAVGIFLLVIEVIAGIVLLFTKDKRIGMALLLGFGLSVLIGFSACSIALNGLSVH